MFSGIVEEIGNVVAVYDSPDGRRLEIEAKNCASELKIGESIAVAGCCLTVVEQKGDSFSVEIIKESLTRTNLGKIKEGDNINLERSLKMGDRISGHLVSGHIDTVGQISKIEKDGFSKVITIGLDSKWAPFIVEKGSIALDGVSLTVACCDSINKNSQFNFSVALIPHTLEVTTLGKIAEGNAINIEIDLVARHVIRWLEQYVREPELKSLNEIVNVAALNQPQTVLKSCSNIGGNISESCH